mmetsp:Transcript_16574/g.47572  ORF Transcript_16574/g.47572 Transcript_16574/m.47572 type:complete len:225 (-) Transcript_16574:651-1325(-)
MTSPSRMSLPRYFGVVMATSVCSFRPNLASSSSSTQPILTPFGPLYLNILANPGISVCVFLVLPPTHSYKSRAVWMPSSLVGTTMSASGDLTSEPDFPRVDMAAPVAMVLPPPPPTCFRPCPRIVGLVCTATRASKSSATSPTSSSALTRMRCLVKSESDRVDSMGTKYARVLPDPVLPDMTTPIFPTLAFRWINSSSVFGASSPFMASSKAPSMVLTASKALI